jgi:hypothetical protein
MQMLEMMAHRCESSGKMRRIVPSPQYHFFGETRYFRRFAL